MLKSLYVAANAPRSGKSLISLGFMELLSRRVERLGFFRPVIRQTANGLDNDIELMRQRYQLQGPYDSFYGITSDEATQLISQGKSEELLTRVFARYKEFEKNCDFVLCEGSDLTGLAVSLEFNFNAKLANQLDAPVLVVANGHDKTLEEATRLVYLARDSFIDEGCRLLALMVNRLPHSVLDGFNDYIKDNWSLDTPVYALPEEEILSKPTIGRIATALNATPLHSTQANLNRVVRDYKVAAMSLANFIGRIEEGHLLITPGDRADLVLGALTAFQSSTHPKVAGIILTGGLQLDSEISRLIVGYQESGLPIYSVTTDTFETASHVRDVVDTIAPDNRSKIAAALGLFEKHVNHSELERLIEVTRSGRVTPVMFQYELLEKAKANKKHVVLPEGSDERLLRATEILLNREVVDITLLGDEQLIRQSANSLGLNIEGAQIIDPATSEYLDDYARIYFGLRQHKGITEEQARDIMLDVSYFGTMMVYQDQADAMVSGAVHTTSHTIRPALEFVKVHPSRLLVSSVFFMCLQNRVLVYGDCAVNPNPTPEQLADIAIASAETAKAFEIDPRIAMLSYSSGSSGKGADVEKVRTATELVKQQRPDLLIEGPIQFDAAVDPGVGRQKMPDSDVAGRATVFIFPDLNTGNNTYKAVQRSANTIAMGPVLQGLRKPVNDLSRGCSVADIVNTVAITAIQAQSQESSAS